MDRAWLWVICGGFLEMVWAIGMDLSKGFTVPLWTVVTFVFIILSTYFLYIGLKKGLPAGPSYTVWVGIGAASTIVVSVVFLGEAIPLLSYFFLALVIIGVVGVNLS